MKEKEAQKLYGKTELDDNFFSLREMEDICEQQEKNADEDVLDDEMYDQLYGGQPTDLLGTSAITITQCDSH